MANAETEVECPICGGTFDPTAAGGWCTNPDCGEWQYEGGAETEPEPESDARDDPEPTADEDDTEGAEASQPEATDAAGEDPVETAEADDEQLADDAAQSDAGAAAEEDSGGDATAETDADTETDPVADEAAEPATEGVGEADADTAPEATADAATDAEDVDHGDGDAAETGDTTDADTDDAAEEPATIACPDCGTELAADANFCIECGADVQTVEPGSDELTECPSCGVDLDGDEHFCANCGEDLDAHRGQDESEAETTGADAVETLAAQTEDEEEDEPVPDSLVLTVLGTDIDVADGDRVGRDVRAALTDAGRPEDEAVRIHREHVRFVREADSFYLVDLGDNPTKLNGRSLQKGDREPVGPGDELELSGVATIAIDAP